MVVLEAPVTVQVPAAAVAVKFAPGAVIVLVIETFGPVPEAALLACCVTKIVGVLAVTVTVVGCSSMVEVL